MPATYEPISTTTLGSAASSITFSSIPNTYTDLRLVLVGKYTATGSGTNSSYIRFNSDNGTNYSYTCLYGNGSASGSFNGSSTASSYAIETPAAANIWGLSEIDIFSYAGSTNKTVLSRNSADANGSGWVGCNVVLWRSTSAINTVTLVTSVSTWAVGTTATLYGILKA